MRLQLPSMTVPASLQPGWATAGQTLRPLRSKVIHNEHAANPKERMI